MMAIVWVGDRIVIVGPHISQCIVKDEVRMLFRSRLVTECTDMSFNLLIKSGF